MEKDRTVSRLKIGDLLKWDIYFKEKKFVMAFVLPLVNTPKI